MMPIIRRMSARTLTLFFFGILTETLPFTPSGVEKIAKYDRIFLSFERISLVMTEYMAGSLTN
jgi:hypothetical protein